MERPRSHSVKNVPRSDPANENRVFWSVPVEPSGIMPYKACPESRFHTGEERCGMLRFIKRLLPTRLSVGAEDTGERRDKLVRSIARRNAQGNVRLTQGKMVTARQIERLYKRDVADAHF